MSCPPGFASRMGWVAIGLLIMTACTPMPAPHPPSQPTSTQHLSESEQIAGEIMAYLMEVVLGQAGDTRRRSEWASRGENLPLDFDLVEKRMFGPVPLRAELMVMDTNILGLTEVLYHYDRRLNLFKGQREHDSLYPCAELMAIRLLLLRKLARGERVGMAAVVRNKALFKRGSRDARPDELAAMNLTEAQFRFLKAIFQSEPAFLGYMTHPFLISTLKRIGVAEQDTLSLWADQMANYRRWASPARGQASPPPVTIAILPSMTALFDASDGHMVPLPEYEQLIDQLKQAILAALARNHRQVEAVHAPPPGPEFFTPLRPMVIHPDNAGRVIAEVCPRADFVLIVLGKNVYRALSIDPDNDIFPHQRRIYLDVDDIRYHQIDDEIQAVADAVMPALIAAEANQNS